jgi:hypothetical protein
MKSVIHLVLIGLSICTGCGHLSHGKSASDELQPEARCGSPERQTYFSYNDRGMESRVIDRLQCGVVELRVIDSFDVEDGTHTRIILRDLDRDGDFERHHERTRPLAGSFAELANGRTMVAPNGQELPPRQRSLMSAR